MPDTILTIPVFNKLARQLPAAPEERRRVLELGLKEWRLREALDDFRSGEGSLAYHASRLGLPLREMISLAHAHGLMPEVDEDDRPLVLERAGSL